MSFLQKVDEYILDRIEHVCHSIQRTVGMTNFDLARYALLLYIAFGIAESLFSVQRKFFLLALVSVCFFVLLNFIDSANLMVNLRKNFVNVYRTRAQIPRIVSLLTAFVCTVELIIFLYRIGNGSFVATFGMYSLALFLYLVSCTPLPPGTSKLGEFFKKLKPRGVPQVQPSEL